MNEDDDLVFTMIYGCTTLGIVETWPTLVCPTCWRQHAHPPSVTADYWPMCFPCWEARPACFQRREETP